MDITRREAGIAALAALAVAAVMLFPVALSPWRVLGAPRLEAENHLFLLWRTAETALGAPGPWNNLPDGDRLWVQDWIHLPWFALLRGHATLAWNLAAFGDAWMAAFAGWWLAREAGADRHAAYIGMISLGTAPVLGGVFVFGLSEAWTLGWWALHAAALLRAARTGSPPVAVIGGVALAAFAASGWYAATFAALGAPVLLLWAGSRGTDRRGWALIAAQGALAALLIAPLLASFLAHADVGTLTHRDVEPWAYRGDWRVASGGGADIMSAWVPPLRHTSMPRTAYLGLATVILALLQPRRTWPMLLGAGVFSVFAMGPYVQVFGWPVLGPLPAPAAWIAAMFPVLHGIGNWYRAAGLAAVFVSAGAALSLSGRSPRIIALACALVALDAIALGEAPWPRAAYERAVPKELLAVPGDGPMLLLPFTPATQRPAHRVWQPQLRRPLADNYEGATAVRRIPWVAWVESRCGERKPPMFDPRPPAVRPSDEQIAAAAAQLRDTFDVVVLMLPETADADGCLAELERGFGPADRSLAGVAWWRGR